MSLPPAMRRAAKHAIGQAGRKSEKRLAKKLSARARPASGAMLGAKGDIEAGQALVECKSTTGRSISVEHSWLGKIAAEARAEGKTPVLTLSFTNGDGRPVPNGEWAMIPLYRYREVFGD